MFGIFKHYLYLCIINQKECSMERTEFMDNQMSNLAIITMMKYEKKVIPQDDIFGFYDNENYTMLNLSLTKNMKTWFSFRETYKKYLNKHLNLKTDMDLFVAYSKEKDVQILGYVPYLTIEKYSTIDLKLMIIESGNDFAFFPHPMSNFDMKGELIKEFPDKLLKTDKNEMEISRKIGEWAFFCYSLLDESKGENFYKFCSTWNIEN